MNNRGLYMVLESAGMGGTEAYVDALTTHLGGAQILTLDGDTTAAQARFGPLARSCQGARGLFAHLAEAPPDSAVCLHLYTVLLPALAAVRLRRLRCIVTFHQPLGAWSLRHQLAWRLAARLADQTIGVSPAVTDGWRDMVTSAPPLHPDFLRPPLHKARCTAGLHVIGIGRLSREKDWPTLIHAAAQAGAIHLTIAGAGPQEPLRDLALKQGVDLQLPGPLDRAALLRLMAEADACVHPARFEGFGLAPVEAMATGLPTITARYPAARGYLIDGETGLSFDAGDVAGLAACLTRLAADPGLRTRLGQAGAGYVRDRFTAARQFAPYRAALGGSL